MHSSRRTCPPVFAQAIVLVVAPLLFVRVLSAQTTSSTSSGDAGSLSGSISRPAKPPVTVETSVSLGAAANLFATRIQATSTTLTTESFTPSAQVLATFRQTFKPWLGYSVNVGYSQPTYRYTVAPVAGTRGYVSGNVFDTHAYEVSLSYIAHTHITPRLSLFGEAGAGTVGFAVINNGILPRRSNAFRPTGIAGAGVDYRLPYGFGLRAQYRGLFLTFPFPNDDNSIRPVTLLSQPSLSLTYTFGSRRHK